MPYFARFSQIFWTGLPKRVHQNEISRKATSDDNGCVNKLITRLKHEKLDSGKALYVRNLPGDTAKEANYRRTSVFLKGQINFRSFKTVYTQLQSAPRSSKNVNDQLTTGLDSKRFNLKGAHRIKQTGKALHLEGDWEGRWKSQQA